MKTHNILAAAVILFGLGACQSHADMLEDTVYCSAVLNHLSTLSPANEFLLRDSIHKLTLRIANMTGGDINNPAIVKGFDKADALFQADDVEAIKPEFLDCFRMASRADYDYGKGN